MSYDGQLLKGTVSIMVLKLLSENDRYGYQIIKELEGRSDSVFMLNEGALYPVLHKLEKEGNISSYWEESGMRKRKYYHLTHKGSKLFESKRQEWLDFSSMVSKILRREQLCKKTCPITLTGFAPLYAVIRCVRQQGASLPTI
ncbi:MAG: PadR family transcriptional regulator [Oscillospiraceae bacterium]|nr:PadR family transcriptional regulator [Oscillospiraceae bacterium]